MRRLAPAGHRRTLLPRSIGSTGGGNVVHDSYGSFCETDGPGTGAPLIGRATATLVGTTVHHTFESFTCGNGEHGVFDPPLEEQSELTPDGLVVSGYYTAVRVGAG